MARRLVVGIDLGGTKICGGIGDTHGNVDYVREQPTSPSGGRDVVDQVVAMIRELKSADPDGELVGIGVGVPGITASETGEVVWAPNLAGWTNVPLGETLRNKFQVPSFVENDVDVAVLGEWWQGAGQGARNVFLMAVGTGIGGGIVIDGKLYKGSTGIAGAIGWSVVGEDRLFQEEYKSCGVAEYLAAGPGIGRRGQEAARRHPESAMVKMADGDAGRITSRTVFEAAHLGDAVAREVVDHTARILGILVANVISLLNPEVVIIGGGVGEAGDILLKPLEEIAKAHAQPIAAKTVRIVPARLGNRAGLTGALCLAAQNAAN